MRDLAKDLRVNPATVAKAYQSLAEAGVQCTLKHFPGLGGVFEDTHLEAGHLRLPRDELERSDWVPFRALMGSGALGAGTFTMLSHAKLAALDADHPVSFSPAVVSGLLREAWGYEGVLITDDFSMGAAYASREGIAAASVAARFSSRGTPRHEPVSSVTASPSNTS